MDAVVAYRTILAQEDPKALDDLRRGVDAILFTSASTVRHFTELAGRASVQTGGAVIACIGPITAQAAREMGLDVQIVATEYTIDGLVQALANYFETNPR